MTYTVNKKIHFSADHNSKKTIQLGTPKPRLKYRTPRVAKFMALAIIFDDLLKTGQAEDLADISRNGRVSRARITQIMNLLLLAPDIQEKLLTLPKTKTGKDKLTLAKLQKVALEPDWVKQRELAVYLV